MCKSKYQVFYTYLVITLLALVGVANHFNFDGVSSADAFVTESYETLELGKKAEIAAEQPELADDFVAKAGEVRFAKVASVPNAGAAGGVKVRLPAARRVSDTSVDAGSGIKIYRNMLYAHSSLAGAAFKQLGVGDLFEATVDGVTGRYRVVSRKVYTLAYLDTHAAERRRIYGYDGGLALMTCGNGSNNDSAYRLVLLAERV